MNLYRCGGWDLNPWIPAEQGPKPCAFSKLGNPRVSLESLEDFISFVVCGYSVESQYYFAFFSSHIHSS